MSISLGIMGMGVVGKAIYKGFYNLYQTYGYDIDQKLSLCDIEKIIQSNIIFLCLPTPSKQNGDAETLYIHEAISTIVNRTEYQTLIDKPLFVLKSTVPIGTTSLLQEKYDIKIVHCPEFLSEKTAESDFLQTKRLIIGTNSPIYANLVLDIFYHRFSCIKTIIVSPEESEFIKYFCNAFYATKITFFNEMRLLSDRLDLDWSKIILGVLSSGWISPMHTNVPGADGRYGYGGSCFPKDILALSNIFKNNELNSILLDATIKQNDNIRNK